MSYRRTIRLEKNWLLEKPLVPGRDTVFSVLVDWPELQLNEAQMMENSLDILDGKPMRHCPSGLILIEVVNK